MRFMRERERERERDRCVVIWFGMRKSVLLSGFGL